MGVSKFLGYLVGIPNILGGVHNNLGYMEWGCQISWDAKYTATLVFQILKLYLSHSTD